MSILHELKRKLSPLTFSAPPPNDEGLSANATWCNLSLEASDVLPRVQARWIEVIMCPEAGCLTR